MKKSFLKILPFCIFLVFSFAFGDATCHIEQGVARPANCTGVNTGGLCAGNNYEDITFAKPFTSLPAVIVAARRVSDQAGCV